MEHVRTDVPAMVPVVREEIRAFVAERWVADYNPWTLLGPAVQAGALWYAVLRGQAVLTEWRLQKLAERYADVAVKAFMIALRYSHVIRQMASGVTIAKDDRPDDVKLQERWSVFDKLDNEFNDTIWLVRAQLGDKEADAIDALGKIKSRLFVTQGVYLTDKSMYHHAYGDRITESVDQAIAHVRDVLQPHIRMESIKQRGKSIIPWRR